MPSKYLREARECLKKVVAGKKARLDESVRRGMIGELRARGVEVYKERADAYVAQRYHEHMRGDTWSDEARAAALEARRASAAAKASGKSEDHKAAADKHRQAATMFGVGVGSGKEKDIEAKASQEHHERMAEEEHRRASEASDTERSNAFNAATAAAAAASARPAISGASPEATERASKAAEASAAAAAATAKANEAGTSAAHQRASYAHSVAANAYVHAANAHPEGSPERAAFKAKVLEHSAQIRPHEQAIREAKAASKAASKAKPTTATSLNVSALADHVMTHGGHAEMPNRVESTLASHIQRAARAGLVEHASPTTLRLTPAGHEAVMNHLKKEATRLTHPAYGRPEDDARRASVATAINNLTANPPKK